VQGNRLYVLCTATLCPDLHQIWSRAVQALNQVKLAALLPPQSPPLYQVVLYGKALSAARPQWAKVIDLNQLHQYEQQQWSDQSDQGCTQAAEPTGILTASNLELARQGQPAAIAHYLSEVLHQQGIAVQAKVKRVSRGESSTPLRRLLVQCESTYSPDPTQLADLIAPRLRQLELRRFRDAIVVGTVHGEREADWCLGIDLTPLDKMLRQWARWGDAPALIRLINVLLAKHNLQAAGIVLDQVLHLTCWSLYRVGHPELDVPPQATVIQVLLPLLEALEPQGLQAACFYSSPVPFLHPTPQSPYPEVSDWIHNCTLSAISPCDRSPSPEQLAQAGNFDALTYLLNRCLNPDLDRRLATGGLRVQIRGHQDLLHLMVDGSTLPSPRPVVKALANAVRSLGIPAVNGIRIYGRQSGQRRPQWQEAVDFVVRRRLVPEATPEFAASEAYVADLIRQQARCLGNASSEAAAGALALRTDADAESVDLLQQLWTGMIDRLRTFCLGLPLFVPAQPDQLLTRNSYTTSQPWRQDGNVAVVWVALGALVTVWADWGLGFLLAPRPVAPRLAAPLPPQELSWSGLVLHRNSNQGQAFNSAGFTGPQQTIVPVPASSAWRSSPADDVSVNGVDLLASPLQARANPDLSQSPYSSFDTPQLDKKLALYQESVARTGVPDVLIVGSSRALRGLDPVALQGALAAQGLSEVTMFNFGINGATAQVVDLIVRRLLPAQQLPRLIIWADGARAFNSNRTDFTFNALAASPGYAQLPQTPRTRSAPVVTAPAESWQGLHQEVVNRYRGVETLLQAGLARVSFTYSQRDALVGVVRDSWLAQGWGQSATTESAMAQIDPTLEGIDVNGFLPLAIRFNPTTYYQKYARVAGASDADYTAFQLQGQQTAALQRLCAYLKQQHSALVFVNLPLTTDYLDADRRTYEAQFQQSMIQWAKAYGFTYRNLAELWKTEGNYFSDPSHLNRYGAYAVAQQLAQDALIPWSR
jgi:hypothetical protein